MPEPFQKHSIYGLFVSEQVANGTCSGFSYWVCDTSK